MVRNGLLLRGQRALYVLHCDYSVNWGEPVVSCHCKYGKQLQKGECQKNSRQSDSFIVLKKLAKNKWRHVQHYANAKTSIVQEIMKRANSNNA